MKKIEVVPYESSWEEDFLVEKEAVQMLFPEKVKIYDIGSTSIPNMIAEPIIDLMIVISNIKRSDYFSHVLCSIGYEPMGEKCAEDRQFFIKCGGDCRVHIHDFKSAIDHQSSAFKK